MPSKDNCRSGNITAVLVVVAAGLLILGGTLYYIFVFSPAQPLGVSQSNQQVVEGAANRSLSVDELDQKVKGVSTTDTAPTDELNSTKDTLGL